MRVVDADCHLPRVLLPAHNSSKDYGAAAAAAGGQFTVDFGAHTHTRTPTRLLLLLRQGVTVPIRHAGLGCDLKLPPTITECPAHSSVYGPAQLQTI